MLNAGAIIENSIMKYHEGNKRGLIPHPANHHLFMYKGWCEGKLGRRRRVPQCFTINPDWGKQGAKKSKEEGGHSGDKFRDEEESARQEEETLMVKDQEEQNQEHSHKGIPLCLQRT